jgi:hypothetical protein
MFLPREFQISGSGFPAHQCRAGLAPGPDGKRGVVAMLAAATSLCVTAARDLARQVRM